MSANYVHRQHLRQLKKLKIEKSEPKLFLRRSNASAAHAKRPIRRFNLIRLAVALRSRHEFERTACCLHGDSASRLVRIVHELVELNS